MYDFRPANYGPVLGPLLETDRRRPLGSGRPAAEVRARLPQVTEDEAFGEGKLSDRSQAACCVAGVWLLYDCLAESHEISQGIATPTGSFWHGIMHRREGDYSNAKYWFRRAGAHDVLSDIGARAAELAAIRGERRLVDELTTGGEWNPFAFVDVVEAIESGRRADAREVCLDIQQAEWEVLFDWCYTHAGST